MFGRSRRGSLIPAIIVINIAVFLLWHFYSMSFVAENFLISWTALEDGRYWTLLTAAFSHNLFIHIAINMFVLHSFGTVVEQVLGTRRFLAFYIIAGIISSLSHAFVSMHFMSEPNLSALGASGSLAGIVLLFSLFFPQQKILIFGLIPMPALVGALAFIGLDIWGLMAQTQGGGLPIGHGAHLGGAFSGIIYYFFLKRKARVVRY